MLIEIDTIILEKYDISPNQYIFLYLLLNSSYIDSNILSLEYLLKSLFNVFSYLKLPEINIEANFQVTPLTRT